MPLRSMKTVEKRLAKAAYGDAYTGTQFDTLAQLQNKAIDPNIMQILSNTEFTESQTLAIGKIIAEDPGISLKTVQYIADPQYDSEKIQDLYSRSKILKTLQDAGMSDDTLKVLADPSVEADRANLLCAFAQKDNNELKTADWTYLATPGFSLGAAETLYNALKAGLQVSDLKLVTQSTNNDNEIQAYIEAYEMGTVPEDMQKMTSRNASSDHKFIFTEQDTKKEKEGLDKDQIIEAALGYQDRLPDEIIKAYTPIGEEAYLYGKFDKAQMQEIRKTATKQMQNYSMWTADFPDETVQFYKSEHGDIPDEILNSPIEIRPDDPEHMFAMQGVIVSASDVIVIHEDHSIELMTNQNFQSKVQTKSIGNVLEKSLHSPAGRCLEKMEPMMDPTLGTNKMRVLSQCMRDGYATDQMEQIKQTWFPKYNDEQIGVILHAYNTKNFPEDRLKQLSSPSISAKYMEMIRKSAAPKANSAIKKARQAYRKQVKQEEGAEISTSDMEDGPGMDDSVLNDTLADLGIEL